MVERNLNEPSGNLKEEKYLNQNGHHTNGKNNFLSLFHNFKRDVMEVMDSKIW